MKDLRYLQSDPDFQARIADFVQKYFIKETKKIVAKYHQALESEQKFPKSEDFNAVWSELKELFLEKQKGRCAICEKELNDIYSADIEHYRPKSHYWWLAYNPSNYYLACGECNRSYKSANFPLDDEKNRVDYDTKDLISSEIPLLINPLLENSTEYFKLFFIIDSASNKGVAILQAQNKLDDLDRRRATKTIEVFNLDLGNSDSCTHRSRERLLSKYYNDLIEIAHARLEIKDKGTFINFLKQKIEGRQELKSLDLLKLILNNQLEINPLLFNNAIHPSGEI